MQTRPGSFQAALLAFASRLASSSVPERKTILNAEKASALNQSTLQDASRGVAAEKPTDIPAREVSASESGLLGLKDYLVLVECSRDFLHRSRRPRQGPNWTGA